MLNQSTSEAQSMKHHTPSEYISNGRTVNGISGGEICVEWYGSKVFMEAGLEECRIALRWQAAICSACYMKGDNSVQNLFPNILFRKQAHFIFQFCMLKQNIAFSSIYL